MNTLNLKKSREFRHFTQAQMAEKLGITSTAYQNYEYGKREPNNDLLCKIANLLGVTTDYLLGRETTVPEPLNDLSIQFNMTALEKKILDNYLALPKNMRADMMEFLHKSVKEVMEESNND